MASYSVEGLEGTRNRSCDFVLHFHGFEGHDAFAFGNFVAGFLHDFGNLARHWSSNRCIAGGNFNRSSDRSWSGDRSGNHSNVSDRSGGCDGNRRSDRSGDRYNSLFCDLYHIAGAIDADFVFSHV